MVNRRAISFELIDREDNKEQVFSSLGTVNKIRMRLSP